jgi:predicted RNA-binding Zn-ribbon protein involved in translation (DUF1610 family)
MGVPRPRVPELIKRAKRQARQKKHRSKPEVILRKKAADHDYYEEHKESIKAGVRGRQELGGDPAKIAELRARYRIIGPHEPIPPDAGLATRNACGTKTNERADLAYILESRWPDPDSPWGFVTGCPDLSTLLGLGGKGQNLELKEFIRDEMLRRFPDRYPHREDLPNEEEVLRRNVGSPDKRETEKRVRETRVAKLTAEFQCPNCPYNGPMLPTGKGPYLAEKFTTPETREKLGVAADDLLPGLFCPRCRVLVVFRPEVDLSPARAEGTVDKFRCECGYTGRLVLDESTGEYNCPECGLVVGMTLEDRPPPSKDDE